MPSLLWIDDGRAGGRRGKSIRHRWPLGVSHVSLLDFRLLFSHVGIQSVDAFDVSLVGKNGTEVEIESAVVTAAHE